MQRYLLTILGLMLLGAMAAVPAARADSAASATADVYVTVDPNIAMSAVDGNIDMGTVQTGDFGYNVEWRVDANTQFVDFWAEATPLFKADDPLGTDVAPIPLNLIAGVTFTAAHGSPLNAGGPNVAFFPFGPGIGGYPSFITEHIVFESSQNNHFSQSLWTQFTWNQNDPEKPMGQYSGKVKLNALVLPGYRPEP